MPEVLDWSNAQRGKFYRPLKQQLTLRLDAEWSTGSRCRPKAAAIRRASTKRCAIMSSNGQGRRDERASGHGFLGQADSPAAFGPLSYGLLRSGWKLKA